MDNQNSFTISNFNKDWPTRIIIHGFQAGGESKMASIVKDAYLKKGDFNVISVDWSPIARKLNYAEVAKKVPDIAQMIADFAMFLYKIYNIPFHDMYLIGHSLGAQIAGVVGRRVVPHQFNTIFALDPASPKFKGVDIEDRIDMTDAGYVESIQTDIFELGYKEPIGHASFYPNYGKTQPGCNLGSCMLHLSCKYGCSHRRSYEYFAESIYTTTGFWANRCNDYGEILGQKCNVSINGHKTLMGGDPSIPKFGVFYLPTKASSPFANGP